MNFGIIKKDGQVSLRPAVSSSLFYEDSDGESVYLPSILSLKHMGENKVQLRFPDGTTTLCRRLSPEKYQELKARWQAAIINKN